MRLDVPIGVIVYNTNHLKSEQTLLSLWHRGYRNIIVYALPFVSRKPRTVLFSHRPDQQVAAHPKDICRHVGYEFIPVSSDREIDDRCAFYLIAGAGILSPECVSGKKILNIHPGVVPVARGLDAFKWSIYHMRPMGVTLHYIDEQVDMGKIVSIVPTPVFCSDSLESFARRHYENEINLIVNFSDHLEHPSNPFEGLVTEESTRRMPQEIERCLLDKFEQYKDKFSESLPSTNLF